MALTDILDITFLGNTVGIYLIFTVSLLASLAVVKAAAYILRKQCKVPTEGAEESRLNLIACSGGKYLLAIAYFAAFYLNTTMLTLSPFTQKTVNVITVCFISFMAAIFLSTLLTFALKRHYEKAGKAEENLLIVKWAGSMIKVVIFGLAAVLLLDNAGIKVNALIAGLGIGGLAVAFAAQSVLADLFCFITILFDRPFEIGDFIISGQHLGTVEHIGIKTTRLRSISGEQLILSNADLTNSRIQNFKTLEQRRVLFHIGVTYDTPLEQMKEIPLAIQAIIESTEGTTFGRAHFYAYSAYSLDFEIVYFVMSNDYNKYMDIHQEINLQIKDEFERRGVEFAFPTQTIHMESPDMLR